MQGAPEQFGAEGQATGVADAICGPVAAIAFARAMGRQPTIAEALEIAKANGRWDPGTGMHGPAAEAALLTDMGVPNRLDAAPTREAVIADVASGNPVILSSPGHYHYFVVTGYDPKTGLFDTGNTGTALRGGSRYRTWEDIGPQAALFMQEPTARGPSAAVAPTTTSGAVMAATDTPRTADPNPYGQMARDAATAHGVPPDLLRAQLQWESGGFDPDVISGKRTSSAGAVGLGQFMPATAQAYGVDPTDPRSSADGAARYMADLFKQYGDWDLALIAYNGGGGAVRAYQSGQPYAETQAYLANIHRLQQGGGDAGATTPGGTPQGRTNDSPFAPAEQPTVTPPEEPSDPWAQVNATLQDTRDRLARMGSSITDGSATPEQQATYRAGLADATRPTDPLAQPQSWMAGAPPMTPSGPAARSAEGQSGPDPVGWVLGQGQEALDRPNRAVRSMVNERITNESGAGDTLQAGYEGLTGTRPDVGYQQMIERANPALAQKIPDDTLRTVMGGTPQGRLLAEAIIAAGGVSYSQAAGAAATVVADPLNALEILGLAGRGVRLAGGAGVDAIRALGRAAEAAAPEIRSRALLAGGQGVRDMAALGFAPDVGGEAVSLGRAADESNAARPRRNVVRPPGQPPEPPPEPLPVAEAAPPSEPPTAPPAARPAAPPISDVVAAIKRVDPAISDEQALAEAQFYDRFGGPRKAAQGIRSNPKFGTGESTWGEGLLPRTEQVADALENPATVTPPAPPAQPPRPGFAGRLNVSKFPPAIQEALHAAYAADPQGFEAASRGTISDPELERMASEVDVAPLLDKWKPGTIWTAEEQRAARIAVAKTFKDVRDAATAGDSTEATNALALAVQRAQAVAGVGSEAGRLLRQQRSTVAADELLNWREIARGGVEDAFARVNGVHDDIEAIIRSLPEGAQARALAALDEARGAADEGYQAARNGVADHPAEPPATNGATAPETRVGGQETTPPPEAAPEPTRASEVAPTSERSPVDATGKPLTRKQQTALEREKIRQEFALARFGKREEELTARQRNIVDMLARKEEAKQATARQAEQLASDRKAALEQQKQAAKDARTAYAERIKLEQRREAAKDSTRAAAERQAIRDQQAHELRLRAAEDRHAQAMVKLFDAISDPARRNTVRQLVNTLGGRNKNLTPWQQAARAIRVAQRGRTMRPDQQQQLYKNLIKAVTGTDDPTVQAARMRQLRQIVQSGDTVQMGKLLQEANKLGFWDNVQAYYVANLLSGPATHVRNVIGNAVSLTTQPLEGALSAAIDRPLSALQGRPRERFIREGVQQAIGWATAWPDAWQRLGAIMRHGFDPANMERLANVRGEMPGGLKNPANLIFRGLGGMDAFFGHLVYSGQIRAMAYRQARMEGLTGDALARRVADLIDVPPVNIIEAAQKAARYRTFHQELDDMGRAIQQIQQKVPGMRVVMPFVSTPYNIVKYDLERSPLAAARIAWDVAKGQYGGPEAKAAGDLSDRLGRLALGTAVLYGTGQLYENGDLTGNGPPDPGERDLWLRTHQPNSVRVGERWVSWQNLPGVSTTMGLLTGALDAQQYGKGDVGQIAAAGAQGMLRAITQRSFLQGVANLADAMSPGGSATAMGSRLVSSTTQGFVPASALLRRVAQGLDPEVKQPTNSVETFTQNLPGLSRNVQPRLDRSGQPITRDTGGLLGSLFSPAQTDTPTTDPTSLQAEAQGQPFPGTGSTLAGQSLTPEQQRRYQQVRGQLVTARRTALYASPAYKAADAATQQKYADMADNAASAQARDQVMSEFGISTAKDGEPPKYDETKPWVQKLMRESNSADVDALARQISQAASTPVRERTKLQRKLAYYAQYSTAEWRKWSAAQKKARGEMQGVVRGLATATP